ncbi:TetR/AcrR family transcriptional regulator [Brevibacterium casei]
MAVTTSTRAEAKAARREQLLEVAKTLFARHGFHGVRLDDLAKGAGISAPAVYRHFSSKEAVLEELLVGISEYLQSGGAEIVGDAEILGDAPVAQSTDTPAEVVPAPPSPADADSTLSALIDFHIAFAMSEPDLIRIQDRDFAALPEASRRAVRRLQRAYVSRWAQVAVLVHPQWSLEAATVRVHAAFGMMNSTPYQARGSAAEVVRRELRAAAAAALGLPAEVDDLRGR